MGVSFEFLYHPLVKKVDIPKLDATIKKRVQLAIEAKLTRAPEVFGRPLRHSRNGARKLRVGDYRVVFRIVKKEVRIYAIEHRSIVYKHLMERIWLER